MNRRNFLETMLKSAGALAGEAGCALQASWQEEYYYSLLTEEQRQSMFCCVFPLEVMHHYDIQAGGAPFDYALPVVEGTAVLLGIQDDAAYFLTNDHVIAPPPAENVLRDEGQFIHDELRQEGVSSASRSNIRICYSASEITTIILGKRIALAAEMQRNERDDIALLGLPRLRESISADEYASLSPPRFGDDRQLSYGSLLFAAGTHWRGEPRILQGIYAGRSADYRSPSEVFLYDSASYYQMSGGGVFALRNGLPELVGLVSTVIDDTLTVAVPLSEIRRWLDEQGMGEILER